MDETSLKQWDIRRILSGILPGFLFALVAPLIFYVINPDNRLFVHLYETQRSIFVCLVLFAVYFSLAFLAARNVEVAGLVAAILVIGSVYLWQISLIVVLATGLFVLLLWIIRRNIQYFHVNFSLIAAALILGFWTCIQLVLILRNVPTPHPERMIQSVIKSELARNSPEKLPDIYYIILDGYGRADMLKTVYGYDNSPFIKSLQDLGFVVIQDSRSNYPATPLSLNSSLNMQYLDTMEDAMGDTSAWWPIIETLQHNQVRAFLEDRGYRTIFTATNFDYTNIKDGDEYLKPFPVMLNNFEGGFVRFTSLSLLESIDQYIAYPSYSTHRQIIQANFIFLPEIASTPGPKFVFAHIIAPHYPFVFDEHGNAIDPDHPFTLNDKMRLIMDDPTYKQSYIAELQYINSEVIATIHSILENSSTQPVIILQADHGPGLYLNTGAVADTCLYERYSILNAYYLPGTDSSSIPDAISPVNTFRFIFNTYFSSEFSLLPNRSYFSHSNHFYSFQDVTDEIESTCRESTIP